jgi:hypothetical protein
MDVRYQAPFFPLVRDEDWGARLHQADLAVTIATVDYRSEIDFSRFRVGSAC